MIAVRHLPWPIAVLLATIILLLAAGLTAGGVGLPGADLPTLAPLAPGWVAEPGTAPRPRTWSEPGNNRLEVWEKIERDAALVIFGEEMTDAERGRCIKALALALAMNDLELSRPTTDPLLAELRQELTRQLGAEAREVLADLDERAIVRALYGARMGRPAPLMIGSFRAEVGFATYRHWKTTITEGRDDRREERQTMPDTHQPFIRLLVILE
jgi:hypothetical protein